MSKDTLKFWQGQAGINREFPKGQALPDERVKQIPDYCMKPICDVGCGCGRMAPLVHPIHYIGVDVNRTAIDTAKAKFTDHRFYWLKNPRAPYPKANSYLFHTVLLHIPDAELPDMIQRCYGKQIIIAESMDKKYRDDRYVFHRNPEQYEEVFENNGYQSAYYRRYYMDSFPGFWDMQIYSRQVNPIELYSDSYYEKRQNLTLRQDQKDALSYIFKDRQPHNVLSIGCGEGLLEEELETAGANVTGIDFGGGTYRGKTKLQEALDKKKHDELLKQADTLVFCEALEHVPLKVLKEALPDYEGYLVITNIKDKHPLLCNNIDHITVIDDCLFDWISSFGDVVVRENAHLVVNMKGRNENRNGRTW